MSDRDDLPVFIAATLPPPQQWEGKTIWRRDLKCFQVSDGLSWSALITGTPAAQSAFASLVSGGGILPTFGNQAGIASASIVNLGAWGMMPDGKYLVADANPPGSGRGRTSLGIYNGDLAGTYDAAKLTALTATRAADNVLKTAAGVTLNPSGAHIYCAWPASNGDIFFVAVEGGNFFHLYRCKAGTYTVGADAGVTDSKAVLSLGMIGGTQTDQNRILSQRSFCEAKVGSATHYFIGEYNVATGRVNGGAKDAVKIHRSTDGGTTWAVFLEWNTDGTHQVDHVHAIRQDPHTGWIYFMTGDTGSQNMLIAYNGTAAPVAANATAATIAATAGYKLLGSTELARLTDLFFSQDWIYSMPDADTDTGDPSTVAYVSTRYPRTLEYAISGTPVDRVNNIPPVIGVQAAAGDFFLCFCSGVGFGSYPYLDLFNADYKGGGWTRIAKLSVRAAMVPRAFFSDPQGRLWIYNDANMWMGSDADYDGTSKTRSLVMTVGPRAAAPYVYTR